MNIDLIHEQTNEQINKVKSLGAERDTEKSRKIIWSLCAQPNDICVFNIFATFYWWPDIWPKHQMRRLKSKEHEFRALKDDEEKTKNDGEEQQLIQSTNRISAD